jgi:hypothetical protein
MLSGRSCVRSDPRRTSIRAMATDIRSPQRVQVRFATPRRSIGPISHGGSTLRVVVRAFLIGLGLGIVFIAGPAEAWSVAAVGIIAIGSALMSWAP